MTKSRLNPKVDVYIREAGQWQAETRKLRPILLDCGLTEELKWGKPCYTFQGGNIVVIQGFKAYCALLFFKGFLLKDPHGVLKKTGPNTLVGRQIRFTDVAEINAAVLKTYIDQAVEIEKSGVNVPEAKTELKLPVEFQKKLKANAALRTAFQALPPGRQRAYGFFFSAAKQSQTRESRIAKCTPQILKGRGLLDR